LQEGLPWALIHVRQPNWLFFDCWAGSPCVIEAVLTKAFWVDRHGFAILVLQTESLIFFNQIIILLLKIPVL